MGHDEENILPAQCFHCCKGAQAPFIVVRAHNDVRHVRMSRIEVSDNALGVDLLTFASCILESEYHILREVGKGFMVAVKNSIHTLYQQFTALITCGKDHGIELTVPSRFDFLGKMSAQNNSRLILICTEIIGTIHNIVARDHNNIGIFSDEFARHIGDPVELEDGVHTLQCESVEVGLYLLGLHVGLSVDSIDTVLRGPLLNVRMHLPAEFEGVPEVADTESVLPFLLHFRSVTRECRTD